ncbi:MAG: FAD-binding protein [Kiritimatiellae bacterium]|nr:FAD-binding protein [Kiritimatiellia bacterium]
MSEAKNMLVHMVGAGGIGMSGLAILFAGEGRRVSGCDVAFGPSVRKWLADAGVDLLCGHSPSHVEPSPPDLIVRTPAVRDDNPELAAARRLGVRIMSRGEALAGYAASRATVAVCGSHGKTTTSCLTAMLLNALASKTGRPRCGWCIGGWTESLGCVASPPTAGAPFVIEADESDGTLSLYSPLVTVATSIERDHLEHFESFEALVDCFRAVSDRTRGAIVFCADDPVCREVAGGRPIAMGYGFSQAADLRAVDVSCGPSSTSFSLEFQGGRREGLSLPLPGRHNLLNALGALGAAIALGHSLDDALRCLGALDELPHRRFEPIPSAAGLDIVSDYSHHPTEIRALIDVARAGGKPLLAVFQPHRYTRTRALLRDFVRAFAALDGRGPHPDRLVLLPVYPAFEEPLDGGTSLDLYAAMREANAAGLLSVVPELADSVDEVAAHVLSSRDVSEGRRIVVIGAGNVVELAGRLASARSIPDARPRPFHVSFGVQALADRVVDVADEAALADALRLGGRVEIVGQGTNLLPSPLGVRATVLRLVDGPLSFRELADGSAEVVAGCGTPGARLLGELARRGLSGLEFMAGIPGTLGGWLAMNAGTRSGEVGDAVVSVVAFGRNGLRLELSRAECGFSYRACAALRGMAAISATLRFRHDSPDAVRARMREFQSRRFDFAGMRTAGSAFKNPPGGFAGALLEKAGCKGLRVGGAYVSDRHANIVAAGDGATASDILALLEIMRRRVESSCGVSLEREIRRI